MTRGARELNGYAKHCKGIATMRNAVHCNGNVMQRDATDLQRPAWYGNGTAGSGAVLFRNGKAERGYVKQWRSRAV